MEDHQKIYIKLIKKEMNEILNSGSLNPEQQYKFIEQTSQKLILVNDKTVSKTVNKFIEDLTSLEEDFKKQYQKYLDTKADMCKEMYEAINKL